MSAIYLASASRYGVKTMEAILNKLEFQDKEIIAEINDAFRNNVERGLGQTGLGVVLGQEVINYKENEKLEELNQLEQDRKNTRERYAGRNIAQEVQDLDTSGGLSPKKMREIICQALICRPDQISFHYDEALSGKDIIYHYGSLYLQRRESIDSMILPLSIRDNLSLENLESIEKLVLPQSIGGYLNLESLKSAKNLVLPQFVGDYIDLQGLRSIEDLDLSNVSAVKEIHLFYRTLEKYEKKLEKMYPHLKGKYRGFLKC